MLCFVFTHAGVHGCAVLQRHPVEPGNVGEACQLTVQMHGAALDRSVAVAHQRHGEGPGLVVVADRVLGDVVGCHVVGFGDVDAGIDAAEPAVAADQVRQVFELVAQARRHSGRERAGGVCDVGDEAGRAADQVVVLERVGADHVLDAADGRLFLLVWQAAADRERGRAAALDGTHAVEGVEGFCAQGAVEAIPFCIAILGGGEACETQS